MKKSAKIVLSAVLVFSLALFISACSSGGGSSSGGSTSVTSLSTPTQGAQSAAASVTSARNVGSTATQLSNMASLSGTVGAPAFKVFAGANTTTNAASKFVATLQPYREKSTGDEGLCLRISYGDFM